jgi:hypothetical protein
VGANAAAIVTLVKSIRLPGRGPGDEEHRCKSDPGDRPAGRTVHASFGSRLRDVQAKPRRVRMFTCAMRCFRASTRATGGLGVARKWDDGLIRANGSSRPVEARSPQERRNASAAEIDHGLTLVPAAD